MGGQTRDLHPSFLAAMREKLEYGRQQGRTAWDEGEYCHGYRCAPAGAPQGFLMNRLRSEMDELAGAIKRRDVEAIRLEAADVANFAMMVADANGALDVSTT